MNSNMYFEEPSEPKKSFDNFFLGLFGSFGITALMIFFVSQGYLKEDMGFTETYKYVFNSMEFSSIMIASLIPSLVLFYVFYKSERWQSAYGLIVAVLLSMALVFCR